MSLADFPSTNKKAWSVLAEKLMKGAPLEKLDWHYDPEVKLKPYYDSEDFSEVSMFPEGLKHAQRKCVLIESLSLGTDTNDHAQIALNMGSEGVYINNKLEVADSSLFDAILPQYCWFGFEEQAGRLSNVARVERYFSSHDAAPKVFSGAVGMSQLDSRLLTDGEISVPDEDVLKSIELFSSYESVRTILINSGLVHLHGGTITQELGILLAMLRWRIEAYCDLGMTVSEILKNLQLKTYIFTDFYHDVAKLRAMRLLVYKLLACYGYECDLRDLAITCETSPVSDIIVDPYNNYLRKTTQSVAAILGGANQLIVAPCESQGYDELARRISRNIGNILREEAYINEVDDPLAGAYYVESLTDKVSTRSWKMFTEIEDAGGILSFIKSGKLADMLEGERIRSTTAINNQKRTLIGINRYPNILDQENLKKSASTSEDVFRPTDLLENLVLEIDNKLSTGALKNRILAQPVTIGHNLAMQSARVNFAASFLGCGGISTKSPISVGELSTAGQNQIIVICGSDEDYDTLSAEELKLLTEKALHVILAGYPKNRIDELRRLGVDVFIHRGSNLHETLIDIYKSLSIEL